MDLKEICRKLGINVSSTEPKKAIVDECKRIGLSDKETNKVYEYFENHPDEFMINENISFSYPKIVYLIVTKLNITSP
jgi:hypothetical protein